MPAMSWITNATVWPARNSASRGPLRCRRRRRMSESSEAATKNSPRMATMIAGQAMPIPGMRTNSETASALENDGEGGRGPHAVKLALALLGQSLLGHRDGDEEQADERAGHPRGGHEEVMEVLRDHERVRGGVRAAGALDHHRRRLHRGGGLHPGRERQLLHRVTGDGGGDEERPGLDLHQGHDAVDLDRAHDAGHPVARRQLAARLMALGPASVAADLRGRDHPPVTLVTEGLELARAVPAAQRVGADADGGGGLPQGQVGCSPLETYLVPSDPKGSNVKLSARNQLAGTVNR